MSTIIQLMKAKPGTTAQLISTDKQTLIQAPTISWGLTDSGAVVGVGLIDGQMKTFEDEPDTTVTYKQYTSSLKKSERFNWQGTHWWIAA